MVSEAACASHYGSGMKWRAPLSLSFPLLFLIRAAVLLWHDSQEGPIRKAGESEGRRRGYFFMYKKEVWALNDLIDWHMK